MLGIPKALGELTLIVGNNGAQMVAGDLLQETRGIDGLVPVLFLLVYIDELPERLNPVVAVVSELL